MKVFSDDQNLSDHRYFDDGVVELPNRSHRRSVLQLLLVVSFTLGLFFSALNWQGNTVLAIVEMMIAAYSLILFPFARNDQQQFKVSMFFLVPLYSMMLYPLTSHDSSETVYVWILVIPVLSHLLLGRWYGLLLSIIFMSLGFLLFVGRFHENEAIFNVVAASNVILAGIAILVFSHVYEVSRTRAHRKLLHLATTDSLTSLANRTRFLDVFERERNHAVRNGTDLSLLLLDLDHFKHVNDNHGHDVGDEVLKYVSATIKHRLRKTDLACRLGGEEFGVLLPGASLERAISIAETIRKNIADVPYTRSDKLIPLSVSIGAAEYGDDGRDLESLYAIADGHLYAAKAAGRNRVRSRSRVMMRNGELDLALAD
jgi:diguanylate cyclase (GGDEF)-like protein